METNESDVQQKKPCLKRKILGVPVVAMFLILGIGMVMAAGVFYYFFSQTINVHGIINHPSVNPTVLPLIITGDLNTQLNCTIGEFCYAHPIYIENPTSFNQSLTITITMPFGITDIQLAWTDFGKEQPYDGHWINNWTQIRYNASLYPGQKGNIMIAYMIPTNFVAVAFDSEIVITSNMTQDAGGEQDQIHTVSINGTNQQDVSPCDFTIHVGDSVVWLNDDVFSKLNLRDWNNLNNDSRPQLIPGAIINRSHSFSKEFLNNGTLDYGIFLGDIDGFETARCKITVLG